MSATHLRFIPTEPTVVPASDLQDHAVALARTRFPDAREVRFRVEERVQFVDCGENFEHVQCPRCGASLLDAWQDAMDAAYDGAGFGDLSWTTPCCDHATTLNDLDYAWPMGFARAWLEVIDPMDYLPDDLPGELEALVGCSLRVVNGRY